MAQDKHTQLLVELGVIKSQLNNLNDKLAIQNGRVTKTEERVLKLESQDKFEAGEREGAKITWGKIMGVVVATGIITTIASNIISRVIDLTAK